MVNKEQKPDPRQVQVCVSSEVVCWQKFHTALREICSCRAETHSSNGIPPSLLFL